MAPMIESSMRPSVQIPVPSKRKGNNFWWDLEISLRRLKIKVKCGRIYGLMYVIVIF
jgi:hypothetical protein